MLRKSRQSKDYDDGISNVKAWLVGLASVLLVFTVLIMYLALASEKPDYRPVESYIGLSETDAVQKAESEDVEYYVYAQNERASAVDRGIVGLILYTENGKVVGAETRTPAQDSRAAPYVGLTESEAIQTADKDGRVYRVVMRNGEGQAVTDDFRLDRINFTITDGKVTKAEFY